MTKTKKAGKSFLSILLSIALLLSFLPTTALAAGTADNNSVKVELVKDTTTFSGKEVLRVDFYAISGTDTPDNHMVYLKYDASKLYPAAQKTGADASSAATNFSISNSGIFTRNNFSIDDGFGGEMGSEVMFYTIITGGYGYICWKVTEPYGTPAFADYTHISSCFFGLKEGTEFDALPSDAIDYYDATTNEVVCASSVEITVNGGGEGNVFIWKNADGKPDTITVTPTINAGEGVTIVKPEYSGSVSAPTVSKNKGGAVELTAITITGETVEYGYSETNSAASVTNWQASPTFNGLTVGKTLYFFARVTETAEHQAKASDGTSVTVADKETPTCTAPSGVTATYGQTLNDIPLTNPGGNTVGAWSWMDSTQSVGNVGEKTFKAKFTPTDTETYQTVSNVDVTVKVNPKAITPTIADISDQEYTGSAITPTVTVMGDGKTLVKDTDYTVEYSSNTNKGTATVTVKAKSGGNYTFSDVTKDFNIVAAASTIAITSDPSKTYDGIAVTDPTVNKTGSSGAVTYAYYKNAECTTLTGTADGAASNGAAPKNAGSYWVKASVAADANYGSATSAAKSFTISPKNISGANITLGAAPTYNGSEQSISISSVTLSGGPAITSGDYDITTGTDKATNVESKTLTIKGKGNFTGTVTKTWSLQKATPTAADFTLPTGLTKDYTGSPIAVAAPTLNSGKAGAGTVTVKYDGNTTAPTDAGSYTVTFDVAGGMNYEAATNLNIGTLTINKATYPSSITANKNVHINTAQTGVEVDMSTKFGVIKGAAVKSATEGTDGDNIISNVSFSGNVVKFDVASIPDADKTATINVVISCTNFNDINAVLTVKTVGKDEAGVTISGVPTVAKTYGDADFTLTASAAAPGTNGAWTWEASDPTVLQVTGTGNTAKVKILKAGSATVTAKYESDTTVGQLTTANIRANKATVTVAAKNQNIYVNGAVPELTSPVKDTHYTVTGLVGSDTLGGTITMEYQKDGVTVTPDATKAGTYDILINGATVPAGGNYNDLVFTPGKLTISNQSTGGSGGKPATTVGKPGITCGDGGKAVADNKGNVTITPDKGYKVKDVTVNGKSVGAKTSLTGMTTKDKVVVTFEKEITAIPAANFADVPAGHWAENAVAYVYENGLFQGTSENIFEPNTAMDRGMLVTVLWRLDGKPAADTAANFKDVTSGAYYADAVAWANANGIVKGYTANQFAPNDKVTREQMAAILYRYAEHKGYNVSGAADLSGFADSGQISAYAVDNMKWANDAGLMTGRTEKTIAPKGDSTRAEVATMIQRFVQNVAK